MAGAAEADLLSTAADRISAHRRLKAAKAATRDELAPVLFEVADEMFLEMQDPRYPPDCHAELCDRLTAFLSLSLIFNNDAYHDSLPWLARSQHIREAVNPPLIAPNDEQPAACAWWSSYIGRLVADIDAEAETQRDAIGEASGCC